MHTRVVGTFIGTVSMDGKSVVPDGGGHPIPLAEMYIGKTPGFRGRFYKARETKSMRQPKTVAIPHSEDEIRFDGK